MKVVLFAFALVCLTVPAFGAEPAPKPAIDQKALDKLGWKLGSQAYTFRKLSLLETVDTLAGLGLRYIEIYPGQRFSPDKADVRFDHNAPAELIEQFQAKCKSAGIAPVCYGVVGLPNDEAECRKVFDFAKKLGIETVVTEPPADAMELIDKLANEYQINVAIHNHPKPSRFWDPQTVLQACEGRSKRIGACTDTGHWYRSGLVPVDSLKKLQGRIVSLHLKDIDEINQQKVDVPWGTGKCDIPAILAEIKRQGIQPVFSIEYETGEGAELVANVAKCIEFFSQQATMLAGQ